MRDLCFVTTCRGRLSHLKESLPTFLAQPHTSSVVVDYDCPENTAGWVAAHLPEVKTVRATGKPFFEISRARNLGAEAVEADAQWLVFVDADSRLAPNFAEVVRPLLARGNFYRPQPRTIDGAGICIVHIDDFRAIGGYDVVLQGYGMDDRDLYKRLEFARLKEAAFPGELVTVISHAIETRTSNYRVKQVRLNTALNQLYCNVKWDLAKLKGTEMPEEQRAKLYSRVSQAVLRAVGNGQDLTFRITVNAQPTNIRTVLKTTLDYHLQLTYPPGTT